MQVVKSSIFNLQHQASKPTAKLTPIKLNLFHLKNLVRTVATCNKINLQHLAPNVAPNV